MLVLQNILCLVTFSAFLELLDAKKFRLNGISDDVVKDFSIEYNNYMETKQMTPRLSQMLNALQYVDESKNCILCHAGLAFAIAQRRIFRRSDEDIKNLLQSLCVTLKIQPKYVCIGVINLHLKLFLFIFDNRPKINEDQVCGLLLQNKKIGCSLDDPAFDWTVNIDQTRTQEPPKGIITDIYHAADLKIIQITDPHIDRKYKAGANAVCGAPLCCRKDQGEPKNPEEGAGIWGDYRGCDSPRIAVEDAYDQIRKQHKKIDLIYFTGDIVEHGIWETSIEGNTDKIRTSLANIRQIAPNTLIIPILGNHEPHPLNTYAPKTVPQEYSTQWLYDLVAQEWNVLLQNRLQDYDINTIRQGGYYSILVRPGFRVIVLNNNVAYVYNWWLLYDPVFPKEQLQWLHDVLLHAENNKEKVHILTHIPPGDPTNFITWDREYKRIIERFSKTVTNQFNGHTHDDEFTLFYSSENKSQAISSAFNGGSITTYEHRNPNYKLYYVNQINYKVVEHESWTYNLTLANLNGSNRPQWYKMYSFRRDFKLKNLEPDELSRLVQRMYSDKRLAYKYFTFKVKQADTALAKGCNNKCLKNHLCTILTSVPNEDQTCHFMVNQFGASNFICKFLRLITFGIIDICIGL